MTHICVSKIIIIGSDNGLSPGRHQAIIWSNDGILLIGPLWTNFSEIVIEILTLSFKKMRLKVSSVKWLPSCLGPNVLTIELAIMELPYIEFTYRSGWDYTVVSTVATGCNCSCIWDRKSRCCPYLLDHLILSMDVYCYLSILVYFDFRIFLYWFKYCWIPFLHRPLSNYHCYCRCYFISDSSNNSSSTSYLR